MTELLKRSGEFLAHRKGLPVLLAVGLVLLNLILHALPAWGIVTWLIRTNLLLHLGIALGFLGILLGDAL